MAILESIRKIAPERKKKMAYILLGVCIIIFCGWQVDKYYSNKYSKVITEKEAQIKTLQEVATTNQNQAEVAKKLASEYSTKARRYDALIKQLKEKAKEQQGNIDNLKSPASSSETVERLKNQGLSPEVKCDTK